MTRILIALALLHSVAARSLDLLKAAKWPNCESSEDELAPDGEECDEDCGKYAKREHLILYCHSWMCTECCDEWCMDKCDILRRRMERKKCYPCSDKSMWRSGWVKGDKHHSDGSHMNEDYCKDEHKKFKGKYEDLTWYEQQAMACSRGCEQCCEPDEDHDASFLQEGRAKACQRCIKKDEPVLESERRKSLETPRRHVDSSEEVRLAHEVAEEPTRYDEWVKKQHSRTSPRKEKKRDQRPWTSWRAERQQERSWRRHEATYVARELKTSRKTHRRSNSEDELEQPSSSREVLAEQPWYQQKADACSRGCKSCCILDEEDAVAFLQGGRLQACERCVRRNEKSWRKQDKQQQRRNKLKANLLSD